MESVDEKVSAFFLFVWKTRKKVSASSATIRSPDGKEQVIPQKKKKEQAMKTATLRTRGRSAEQVFPSIRDATCLEPKRKKDRAPQVIRQENVELYLMYKPAARCTT